MFNYSKEMAKLGYSLEEYKEQLQYLKDVASYIVNEMLKKSSLSGTGAYQDVTLLHSLIPNVIVEDKIQYNQIVRELKALGVEFIENGTSFRY